MASSQHHSAFASRDELFLALMTAGVAQRVAVVEGARRQTTDLPGALAAVGAELSRREASWQLLFPEFWQRAVRDPDDLLARVLAGLVDPEQN